MVRGGYACSRHSLLLILGCVPLYSDMAKRTPLPPFAASALTGLSAARCTAVFSSVGFGMAAIVASGFCLRAFGCIIALRLPLNSDAGDADRKSVV